MNLEFLWIFLHPNHAQGTKRPKAQIAPHNNHVIRPDSWFIWVTISAWQLGHLDRVGWLPYDCCMMKTGADCAWITVVWERNGGSGS